jgi:hypothetical protein
MKYLFRKCSGYCGNTLPVRKSWEDRPDENMIQWQTDPYSEEIHGNYTKMWLCETCAHEYAMDV